MRAGPTLSEARLWVHLSGSQLGTGFRRQVVLGDHIVDFLAPACRLVVEVDGAYHARRCRADTRRDARLEALGYCVLHLEARLVMRELPVALERIRAALGVAR
jgi:very-short-patch-repair endonuclease